MTEGELEARRSDRNVEAVLGQLDAAPSLPAVLGIGVGREKERGEEETNHTGI